MNIIGLLIISIVSKYVNIYKYKHANLTVQVMVLL